VSLVGCPARRSSGSCPDSTRQTQRPPGQTPTNRTRYRAGTRRGQTPRRPGRRPADRRTGRRGFKPIGPFRQPGEPDHVDPQHPPTAPRPVAGGTHHAWHPQRQLAPERVQRLGELRRDDARHGSVPFRAARRARSPGLQPGAHNRGNLACPSASRSWSTECTGHKPAAQVRRTTVLSRSRTQLIAVPRQAGG